MSISVNLKRISNLPGRSDRKVELSFRGFTHKTRILHSESVAVFNEHFRWPHYGKGIGDEALSVRVYNSSLVFSNRLLGQLVISLQHVVNNGRLLLREPLTDANYGLTDIYIELDVRYHPVDGAAGPWEGLDFLKDEDKDDSDLVIRNQGFDDADSVPIFVRPDNRERAARRLGQSLSPLGEDDDDDDDCYDDDLMDLEGSNIVSTPLRSRCRPLTRSAVAAMPRVKSFQVNVTIQEAQKLAGVNINPAVFVRVGGQKRHTGTQKSTNCPFYNEIFQFEFQEASELFFDKVIEIKVVHRGILAFLMTHIGTFKIDISTVYNQPEHRFYQKWAPLTDPADTRSGIRGYVKATLNVLMKGDALSMPSLAPSSSGANDDIEKNLLLPPGFPSERPWARFRVRIYRAEGLPTMGAGLMAKMSVSDRSVFIDPYVRVTFAGQQGDTSIASATNCPVWNEEISFIEQFPPLAQRIKVQIMDDAKMGDIALATHFLDLQQISDPTRNGFNPTFGPGWVNLYGSPRNSTLGDVHQALNEGVGEGIFYRGRILLALSMEVYSSPSAINSDSSSGAKGKMKGALGKLGMKRKKSSTKDKKGATSGGGGLDEESGEAGVEVPEVVTVEVEETHPLPEGFLGQKDEFLMFASLFEVTMMDPSVGTKPLSFELSIGNNGKAVEIDKAKKSQSREDLRRSREELRGSREELRGSREELSEEAQGLLESEDELEVRNPEPESRSLSAPMKPLPTEYDASYKCLQLQPPLVKLKPCLHVWSQFENHSFRFHQANWLSKMADRLEIGLNEVEILLRRPRSKVKERLVQVLMELVVSCKQFSAFSGKRSQSRPNNLDKCRKEFIKKKLVLVARLAVRARRRITRRNAKQRLTDSRKILKMLRQVAKEPQSTIPDVFIWLLSGSKRLAYARIPAHSVLFSLVEEQKGRDCGKVTTLYMKSPGGSAIEIFAKLEVYLWLGNIKYSKDATSGLPEEFQPVYEEEKEEAQRRLVPADPRRRLPVSLSCQDSRYFQLRCHLYQARGLLAADDDGLSDPFAKVVFSTQCQRTRVLSDTLSPAWCECLLFDRVLLEGTREQLEEDPPLLIINLYDYDSVGRPKPLGRAFAEPEFKAVENHYQKPRLRFYDISLGRVPGGELLATFELIELDYSGFGEPRLPVSVEPQKLTYIDEEKYYIIPDGVRPVLKTFRIEVLFWGLRDLKRVQLFEVERPLVKVECAGRQLESEEMESYKTHPNFKDVVGYIDVELPEQSYLHPPLTVFVVEHRAFGQLALVGSHVVQSLMDYGPREADGEPDEEDERPRPKVAQKPVKTKPLTSLRSMRLMSLSVSQSMIPNPMKLVNAPFQRLKKKGEELEEDAPEKAELDWWSKYYASVEEMEKQAAERHEMDEQAEAEGANMSLANIEEEEEEEEIVVVEVEPPKRKKIATLKLYTSDLESEFRQFQDWLKIFPLQKGKASFNDDEDDEEEKLMGKYKGSFMVYPIDPEDVGNTKCQITAGIPKNSPIKVLVRVYIVKATNLAPSDSNGKADPYLVLQVGEQSVDTKDRYIPKQLNPTFGEVFELTVSFPLETELNIRVMDHNFVGSDDLIGETSVDLENRFYSRHRASCGLALYYDTDGYNQWRDAKRPSTILGELCRENGIPSPEYRTTVVKVLNKIFKIPPDAVPEALLKKNKRSEDEEAELEEHAALSVLQRWGEMNEFVPGALPLVPEHVEVRSLHSQDSPGLPQGYLHMWVDMFPTDVPAPPVVNIKPRLPEQYELRVIIWNTDDVFLGDVNPFTGNPSSDIYVKGWIKGREDKKQETDVHFNSLTGEGNFNWRFVFRFDYLPTEKEVVFKKKESFFSLEESEFRQPAVLTLQVWDYDCIGANDFLGSIEMRLSDMVRPAKASSKCTVKMAKERATPRFSIFRAKKMKGWWPLVRQKTAKDFEREEKEREEAKKKGGKKKKKKKAKDKRSKMNPEDVQYTDSMGNTFLLMGKVEAELQLVTLEQAEGNPVGRGRKDPEALDKPDRPSTTFTWFVNPMKTFIHLIWKKFKKYIIAAAILAVLSVFLTLMIYTLPQQITALIVKG